MMTMKRVIQKSVLVAIVCMLLTVTFCGCGTQDEISFLSGTYEYKDWDQKDFTYTGVAVPNEQCAIEMATSIVKNLKFEGKIQPSIWAEVFNADYVQELIPQRIFYDEPDGIWIVSFWEKIPEGVKKTGTGVNVAIRKEDGKVLRVWVG